MNDPPPDRLAESSELSERISKGAFGFAGETSAGILPVQPRRLGLRENRREPGVNRGRRRHTSSSSPPAAAKPAGCLMRFPNGLPWRNEMSDQPNHDEGQIERAISSLRETPIPLGPSPDLQQRTIRAISLRRRFLVRRYAIASAVAIALLVGLVGPVTYYAYRDIALQGTRALPVTTRINTPAQAPAPLVKAPIQPPSPAISHAPVVAVASDGTVTGHVYFLGSRPSPKPIDLAGCPQCEGDRWHAL